MIKSCCLDVKEFSVDSFNGLLVDYCKSNDVSIIFRGIRTSLDYEYEYAMSTLNMKLAPEVETVFLMSRRECSFVSSNIVKEVAAYHGDIASLVPSLVADLLREKLNAQN